MAEGRHRVRLLWTPGLDGEIKHCSSIVTQFDREQSAKGNRYELNGMAYDFFLRLLPKSYCFFVKSCRFERIFTFEWMSFTSQYLFYSYCFLSWRGVAQGLDLSIYFSTFILYILCLIEFYNKNVIFRVFCPSAGSSLQTQAPRLQFCPQASLPLQTQEPSLQFY